MPGQSEHERHNEKKYDGSKRQKHVWPHIPRGLTINSDGLTEGYIMFAVPNSGSVYLINRKGQVVHEWKGNYGGPATSAYLTDDGSLMQNAVDPDFPVFAGGGEAGRLQKINWNSKIVWDFEYANEKFHTHHDFAVMPNGNILAIAWEAKSADEVMAAGRKPKMTPKAGLWPDKIVEIEPQGATGGKVIWEWHIWDHLIQDYDSKKPTTASLQTILNYWILILEILWSLLCHKTAWTFLKRREECGETKPPKIWGQTSIILMR